MKPWSEACERNRDPILSVLREAFASVNRVLEIGSGTGQHAVYFAAAMPHLVWQTSDLPASHNGIRQWIAEAGLPNVLPPVALDVDDAKWPEGDFDAVFTANTLHIMSWDSVRRLLAGVALLLPAGAPLCVYGPFNYGGRYTSESNAAFDRMLRERNPESAIRDAESVCALASENGLTPEADHAMPANNRLLIFRAAKAA